MVSSCLKWISLFGFIFLQTEVICERWDPLPAGVRTIVSSNHLGEGTPQVFAEYHALLPDYRGDYGVKSTLLDAASTDPIYKGSNTFILPLYIPSGAIPLGLHERTARSGKANGAPNMRVLRGPSPSIRNLEGVTVVNRPILRRVLTTSSRRANSGPRHSPTPPPSFSRPWLKRRESALRVTDNVNESKKVKERVLSQRAHSRRRGESLDETKKDQKTVKKDIEKKDNGSDGIGSKSVKKVVHKSIVGEMKVRVKSLEGVKEEKKVKEEVEVNFAEINKTNLLSNENIKSLLKDNAILKINSTTVPNKTMTKIIHRIYATTSGKNHAIETDKSDSSTTTPVPFPKDIIKTTTKPSTPSIDKPTTTLSTSTSTPATTTTASTTTSISTLPPSTTLKPKTITKSTKQEYSTPPSTTKSQLKSITTTTNVPAVSPSWLSLLNSQRRRPIPLPKPVDEILKKPMKPLVPSSKSSENLTKNITTSTFSPVEMTTISINITSTPKSEVSGRQFPQSNDWLKKRRAQILKEMHSRKEKNDKEAVEKKQISDESIIDRVLNSAARGNEQNSSKNKETLTRTIDFTSVSPPHSIKLPKVKSRSHSQETSHVRQRVPIKVRNPFYSNPVRKTEVEVNPPATNTRRTFVPTSPEQYEEIKSRYPLYSTNQITTSTPKLPISSSTRASTTRSRNPLLPDINSFKVTPANIKVFQTPSSAKPVAVSGGRNRMISPQDIVLEKLTQLMKNATENDMENLEGIAREIIILNRELSAMGIHIIDAEFDGQKIILDDQRVNKNHRTHTFNPPGASTTRYTIPKRNIQGYLASNSETQSQSKPKKFTLINPSNQSSQPNQSTILRGSQEHTSNDQHSSNGKPEIPQIKRQSAEVADIPTILKSNSQRQRPKYITPTAAVPRQNVTAAKSTVVPLVLQTLKSSQGSTSTQSNANSAKTSLSSNDVYEDSPITFDDLKLLNPDFTGYHQRSEEQNINSQGKNASLTPPIQSSIAPSITSDPNIIIEEINVIGHKDEVLTPSDDIISITSLTSNVGDAKQSDLSKESVEETSSFIYLIGLLGIIPCGAALFILYKQRQKKQKKALPEREEQVEGFTPPINHAKQMPYVGTLDVMPGYVIERPEPDTIESPWEMDRTKLKLTSVIGEGNFGVVWKAEVRNLCEWDEEGGLTVLVAVKGVKQSAGAKEKADLLRELSIMQVLKQHPNIVTLLGCCTKHEPYYLVMEYVMFGKLLTFLRDHRSRNNYTNFSSDTDDLTSRDLTKFACQIATGCEYLQSRGVIHRDLAARNILVDHNKVCKIADFGLARSVKDLDSDIYEQKSRGPLPIRWMAPESLYMNIFTHKSDVWSFGILCWEIVTLGSTPYPGISAREVMRRVREGYRLERPDHCRMEFYRILSTCWHQDLNKRPSFTSVREGIRDLLDNYNGWIDLENFPESSYYSMHQNNEEKL